MSAFEWVVGIVAAILLAPALLSGGWVIGIALVVGWLVVAFGGRIGLRIFEKQYIGAKAGERRKDMQDIIVGTDDEDGFRKE